MIKNHVNFPTLQLVDNQTEVSTKEIQFNNERILPMTEILSTEIESNDLNSQENCIVKNEVCMCAPNLDEQTSPSTPTNIDGNVENSTIEDAVTSIPNTGTPLHNSTPNIPKKVSKAKKGNKQTKTSFDYKGVTFTGIQYPDGECSILFNLTNGNGKNIVGMLSEASATDKSQLRTTLANRGQHFTPNELDTIIARIKKLGHMPFIDLPGWYEYNNSYYYAYGNQSVPPNSNVVVSTDNNWFETKGDRTIMYDTMKKIENSSALIFSVGFSLSSLVLYFLNSPYNTNTGINIFGKSTTGKSSCLRINSFILGDNQLANFNRTSASFEELVREHKDFPLYCDELKMIDANPKKAIEAVSQIAYTATAGTGKGRSKLSSMHDKQNAKLQNNVFLVTNEKSIHKMASDAGVDLMAGGEIRLIDINVERQYGILGNNLPTGYSSSKDCIDDIINTLSNNYGYLGLEFVQKIADTVNQDKDAFVALIENYIQDFFTKQEVLDIIKKSHQYSAIIQRMGNIFARTYAVLMLASKWGILPWKQKRNLKACIIVFSRSAKYVTGNISQSDALEELFKMLHDKNKISPIYQNTPSNDIALAYSNGKILKCPNYFLIPQGLVTPAFLKSIKGGVLNKKIQRKNGKTAWEQVTLPWKKGRHRGIQVDLNWLRKKLHLD